MMVDAYVTQCNTAAPITNMIGERPDFMISVGNGHEASSDEQIATSFLDFWTSYSSNYDYDTNSCSSSCNLYLRVRDHVPYAQFTSGITYCALNLRGHHVLYVQFTGDITYCTLNLRVISRTVRSTYG